MNKKTWIIFAVICVAIFGTIIYISRKNQIYIDTSKIDANAIQAASPENGNIADHVAGSPTAKVRLIEYGDIQCPACGGAHPGIKQIIADYGDKIGFVFRNFPLTSAHPNALAAAAAAEAAGLQGKYWQMNDFLYEHQSGWSNASTNERTGKFIDYASQIGLDVEKFKTDLDSSSISRKIEYDQAIGGKVGVTGTPSLYLNGEKLSEEAANNLVKGDAAKLRELINTKLRENGVEPPAKQ